jgi:DNA-binding MarR family transcriptional regulator
VSAVSDAEMSDEDLVEQWHGVTSGVKWVERRVDRVLEDFGVPAHSFAVLHTLLRADEHRSPMNVLAREVSMTSGGFTKLADRMAREGLIDRRSSVADRRVVHAMLTPEGLAMAQQATRLYQDALRECLLTLVSAPELASAAATMQALRADTGHVEESTELMATERSTALPDRRARSRSED